MPNAVPDGGYLVYYIGVGVVVLSIVIYSLFKK